MSIKKNNTHLKAKPNLQFWGIVRVSSPTQKKNRSQNKQQEALLEAGVPENQIEFFISSGRMVSPELREFLSKRKSGEVVVFTDPSRFSRDYFWTVEAVNKLYIRGIAVFPLTYGDPLAKGDELHSFYSCVLHAEILVNKTQSATSQGIERRKLQFLPRKKKPLKLGEARLKQLSVAHKQGSSIYRLMTDFGLSRSTLWRYCKNRFRTVYKM